MLNKPEQLKHTFDGHCYLGFAANTKPLEHENTIAVAIVYSEGGVESLWYVWDTLEFRHRFEVFLNSVRQVPSPSIAYYSTR